MFQAEDVIDAPFDELCVDIRDHGLREPITLHPDGTILDGRNRFRACRRMGVEPRFVDWDGQPGDEIAYVASRNLHRRHLSTSQRAMIAAELANLSNGVNRLPEFRQPTEMPITQPEAAQLMNVSRDSVQAARTVREKGTPALVAAVKAGEISLNAAVERIEAEQAAPAAAKKRPRAGQRQRTTKLRAAGALWRQLDAALSALGSLPRAADLLAAVPPKRRTAAAARAAQADPLAVRPRRAVAPARRCGDALAGLPLAADMVALRKGLSDKPHGFSAYPF